jgi:glutamate synthase (NADPH) small chain
MFCPKCHRPLEGDEVYICCAGTRLQWRCTDCGKVSEGLAFPYGACPLCGGMLELLDERQIADAAALEAVRMALEIELSGQAFYIRAANDSTDPALKDLFGRLADMERQHMETLNRRYHVDASSPSAAHQIARAAIYAGVEGSLDDPLNLFQIAINFENRAVAFFAAQAEKAAEGSMERELYRELAAEERDHAALLLTERDRWKQDKPGIL